MSILRAGCYERVSTDEQAKYGYSIRAQVDSLEEYCKQNNIKIVDHYREEGVSAGKPASKRPEMTRLLNDIREGKVDIVLFTRLDRWYRSTKLYYKVQEVLDQYNVSWKAILEDYETETAAGRFKVNIMLAVAEAERERDSEKIKAVFASKRKRGEAWQGWNSTPFGYIKQKCEDGITRFVKDPDLKDAVQEFWDIAVKYENVSKAAKYVNTKYGLRRTKKLWFDVIRSEYHMGKCRDVENYCEPYVSPENWHKMQNRGGMREAQHNRVYLFTGLLKCPLCGATMTATHTTQTLASGERKEYYNYRCRHREIKLCDNKHYVPELRIESWLLENLEDFLKGEIASVELERTKPKKRKKTNTQAIKEQLRRLEVVYMAGNKTDEEYISESAELKEILRKAEAENSDAAEERDLTVLKGILETDFRSIYETLSREDRRRFWRSFIGQIHVEGKYPKYVDFL